MPNVEVKVNGTQIKKFVLAMRDRFCDANLPGVYGLPRGGLVLAVMISHALNIPLLMAPVEGCLIVDDICDSGESLLHYIKDSSNSKQKKYNIATVYCKKDAMVKPDFYLYTKRDNTWIIFPWEVI